MNKQITMIEEYEINPFTMMIRPTQYGSKIYSEVIELQNEFLSPFRPTVIVDKSCKFFGSSFEGRITGTKQLTGFTHKAPITVDPTNNILLLPTTSPQNSHCTWISLEHILTHLPEEPNSTIVTFRNNKSYVIPVSYSSFNNQIMRTSYLRTKLMQRLSDSDRRSY